MPPEYKNKILRLPFAGSVEQKTALQIRNAVLNTEKNQDGVILAGKILKRDGNVKALINEAGIFLSEKSGGMKWKPRSSRRREIGKMMTPGGRLPPAS